MMMIISILLLTVGCFGFVCAETELYEGSECILDDGKIGACKSLVDCPVRLEEARQGRRGAESLRCGWKGTIEIVCCPLALEQKIGIRAAELACQQYENEVLVDKRLLFHILGGSDASAGEFPYAAALGYPVDNGSDGFRLSYYCGATLISPNFVLTAAHCVSNPDESVPIVVRLGSENLEATGETVQEIRINNIIPHPSFRRSAVYHDIALIKLSKPVKWTATIKPICLQNKAIDKIQNLGNKSIIVVGWGATEFGGNNSAKLQKTPSLEIVPKSKCSESYSGFSRLRHGLNESLVCVIDGNSTRKSDSCQGDSGGPLLMITEAEDILIGITSIGALCGSSVPAIYTSVLSYLDWIESHVWPNQEDSK